MTLGLNSKIKVNFNLKIKNILKKCLFFLFTFIFVFSVVCAFLKTDIFQRYLNAETLSQNKFSSKLSDQLPLFVSSHDNNLQITAQAAIIMEYDTGRILWEKNSSEKLFPASTTKMMTGIIAIEEIENLYDKTIISKNASGSNNSFFPFKTGDKITTMDLLKAALINSNNNATIALAEYISGSESEFLKKMNAKAIEIGAYSTNYQTTNGLDSSFPEHKSTAYDLAVIARYCLENELFRKIVSTKTDYINISGETISIFNTNVLLFFDYIKGVKTGYTNNAGHCLVTFSERQGLKLVNVVLDSDQGMRDSDMLKMINWANENYLWDKVIDSSQIYKEIEITEKIENSGYIYQTRVFTNVYPEKDFISLINVNDKIDIIDDTAQINTGQSKSNILNLAVELPVKKGLKIGNLQVGINQEEKQVMQLQAGEDISSQYIFEDIKIRPDNKVRNIIIFLISFYFLIFILIIVRNLFLRENSM